MKKILLIEDDIVDQKIIKKILDSCGFEYELEIFEDPDRILLDSSRETIEAFELIILDYNFPKGVSSNLLHLLKTDWNISSPVIVLTGMQSDILKENVEHYKMVFYREKNDNPQEKLPSFILELVGA